MPYKVVSHADIDAALMHQGKAARGMVRNYAPKLEQYLNHAEDEGWTLVLQTSNDHFVFRR